MNVNNVCNSAPAAAAAPVVPRHETFTDAKGAKWTVKNGHVQTWFSSTLKAQSEYNEAHKVNPEPDAPAWKRPFIFVRDMISTVFGAIRDAFKSVLAICFGGKAETADDTAKTDTKGKTTKT